MVQSQVATLLKPAQARRLVQGGRRVFHDPYARVIDDPDHSIEEERFVIIDESRRARTLTVCRCMRGEGGDVIRIISARKATKSEARQYRRYVDEG